MKPLRSIGGSENCVVTIENSMKTPRKLKIESPYDPAIPLLGIYPKELKSGSQRYIGTPMLTGPLFARTKMWKQLKCP